MTDNAFFGYILYSAVTLRLINQKELTCRPPVYTELTVSMTFLNYDLLNESVCTDARDVQADNLFKDVCTRPGF